MLRRVEGLNEEQERLQKAGAAFLKPDANKTLLKQLKKKQSAKIGKAPQASAFRDLAREHVRSLADQSLLPPLV